MKKIFSGLQIPLYLLILVLAAVLWDNLLKVTLREMFFMGNNSYQDLAFIRAFEVGMLIILWKSDRVSIFGPRKTWLGHILWGSGIGLVGLGVVGATTWLVEQQSGQNLLQLVRSPENSVDLLTLLAAASIFGPLLEELFFRAFLWQQLEGDRLSTPLKYWLGFWMVLMFAGLHLQWEQRLVDQWPQFFMWNACGLMSLGLMLWRKSILSAWIVHGMANAVLLWPVATATKL